MILYDVMDYIRECIEADDGLPDIEVLEAYKYSHKPTDNEIQCQIIDHNEFERFTTFEDGKIFISPLQFDIYGKQCEVDGEMVSAQKCAYLIAQRIISWLNTNALHTAIPEIHSAKNGTFSSSIPLANVGTVLYRSVVRIDLYIQNIID